MSAGSRPTLQLARHGQGSSDLRASPAFRRRIRARRNRYTGAPEVTLWGDRWRVKIKVYDWPAHVAANPKFAGDLVGRPVEFFVSAVPADSHSSTAHGAARKARGVYQFFDDPWDAHDVACDWFGWEIDPNEDFPRWLAKYWNDECA